MKLIHKKLVNFVNFILCVFKVLQCTIRVAKTKALISFAVTAKLICVFVFAYAKRWFSHGAAQMAAACVRPVPNVSASN